MNAIETPITIIIADLSQSDSIDDCLNNLNSWFPKKILVSNDLHTKNRLKNDLTPSFIFHKSKSIFQMWKQGLAASKTQWNLLITSNEIITGHLKNSIENQIKTKPTTEKLFRIKKKVVFLKKVLKYPLEWPAEFPSCLLFTQQKDNFILTSKPLKQTSFLTGELIQFNSPSIEDAIKEISRLAEIEADRIFSLTSPSKLTTLTIKTILKFPYHFFHSLILKKGFKEGFEGITFSIMRSMISPLALFRYFEKYFRNGKRIEAKLSSLKSILIIKVRGAGDLIITTPFIRNIKNLLPHAKIHVLVTEGCSSLLDNNPYIESVTKIGHDCNKNAFKEILPKLKRLKISLAINLDSASRTTRLLKKIPAKFKINRSYFFRDKNTDALIGFTNTSSSIIEREFDILRAVGLEPKDKHTEVFLSDKEINNAKNFFLENGFSHNKKIVIVSPTGSIEMRDWGVKKFSLLCQNLTADSDIQVIINATQKEIPKIKAITTLSPKAHIFSGSLRELLGIINESDLLIGNDSGPAHFSVALNIPTIILNGSSVSSFYRDPDLIQNSHYIFNKDVPCRDLLHTQCFSNLNPVTRMPHCDEMICLDFSVEEVTNKARSILSIKKTQDKH